MWWQRTATCFIVFACIAVIILAPGGNALVFVAKPQQYISATIGLNFHINCTTDDAQATVKLLQHDFPGSASNERVVTPGKLMKIGQTFTVINAGVSDAGYYMCEATNTFGNETIQWLDDYGLVFMIPNIPPPIKVLPADAQIIIVGQSIDLNCYTEGIKSSKLTWYKRVSNQYAKVSDRKVKVYPNAATNELRSVLTISSAKKEDSAGYKCVVSFNGKTRDAYGAIDVRDPTVPTIEPYNGKTDVKAPSEKKLPCVANGLPAPVVTWYKDGKPINITDCKQESGMKVCENSLYVIRELSNKLYVDNSLKIKKTQYSRGHGTYTCEAKNRVGTKSLIIKLNIQAAPKLIGKKAFIENYQVATNVSCQVNVSATNPLPEFEWFYQKISPKCQEIQNCKPGEDKWIPLPAQQQTVHPASGPTQTSYVSLPKDQSPTFYLCRAKNSVGNQSKVIQFFRTEEKKLVQIDKKNIKTEYDAGSTVRLTCIDRCGPFCGVHWRENGTDLTTQGDPRVNVTVVPGDFQSWLILTITGLYANESGNYTCSSFHEVYEDSVGITVKALEPPIISNIKDVTRRADEPGGIKLTCPVAAYPQPIVTWYRNGKRLDITGSPYSSCKALKHGFYKVKRSYKDLMICLPDHASSTGTYKCETENKLAKAGSNSFHVNVLEKPSISLREDTLRLRMGSKLNETCKATGNPLPTVEWQKVAGKELTVLAKGRGEAQLLIKSVRAEDFGTYYCVVNNSLGVQNSTVKLFEEKVPVKGNVGPLSTGQLIGVVIGCVAVVVVVVIICCVICLRQRKQMKEYRQFYFLREGGDYKIDPDRSLLEQCGDLPYDADWEFPEHRLVMGGVLGAGAFGQVVKAEAIGILGFNPRDKTNEAFKRRSKLRRSMRAKANDDANAWKFAKTTVAVKTLKEGAQESDYKDLASELKILIHLGPHRNIVNLLGACTRGKRLMVIMEFAPHGSLLGFLRSRREIYEPKWTKTSPDPKKEYTLADLLMATYQVSKGLEFLASKKCVHRDVAARNVLVGQEGDVIVMKIADFGLARDVYKDDLYVKKTSGLLPVKWMAPESLFDREYTDKTDVWSFGILMWETFTLGGTPYPGLPTEQLLDYLSEGKRMDQPKDCPLDVYTLMRDCWMHDPDERPPFGGIVERLGNILEKNISQDNPYIMLTAGEDEKPAGNDYYLQPCDEGAASAAEGANAYPGDSDRYVPTAASHLPDGDIPNEPLPSIPPSYDEAVQGDDSNYEDDSRARRTDRASSTGAESGIDVDDGDGDEVNTPLLSQAESDGGKPVTIEMGGVPDPKFSSAGKRKSVETTV